MTDSIQETPHIHLVQAEPCLKEEGCCGGQVDKYRSSAHKRQSEARPGQVRWPAVDLLKSLPFTYLARYSKVY